MEVEQLWGSTVEFPGNKRALKKETIVICCEFQYLSDNVIREHDSSTEPVTWRLQTHHCQEIFGTSRLCKLRNHSRLVLSRCVSGHSCKLDCWKRTSRTLLNVIKPLDFKIYETRENAKRSLRLALFDRSGLNQCEQGSFFDFDRHS